MLEAEEIFVSGNEVGGLRYHRAGNDHIIVWVSHHTADDRGVRDQADRSPEPLSKGKDTLIRVHIAFADMLGFQEGLLRFDHNRLREIQRKNSLPGLAEELCRELLLGQARAHQDG